MIKYVPEMTSVVMEEIPDKVTLAVDISNCTGLCEGCHSPFLRKDVGEGGGLHAVCQFRGELFPFPGRGERFRGIDEDNRLYQKGLSGIDPGHIFRQGERRRRDFCELRLCESRSVPAFLRAVEPSHDESAAL